MTLRKDALVCVSLAGVVLMMAAFSRTPVVAGTNGVVTSEVSEPHHRELYRLYLHSVNNLGSLSISQREAWLQSARGKVGEWHRDNNLRAPIDLFRAAAILGTSDKPEELDLAYELSLGAFSKGVQTAKRLALETHDRLRLSIGQAQRYGTQSKWKGKSLPDFGNPDSEITPALGSDLGLQNPTAR